jgi:hypothetical protein
MVAGVPTLGPAGQTARQMGVQSLALLPGTTSPTTLYGIYSVGRALPRGHSIDFIVGRRTPAVPETSAEQSAGQMDLQSLAHLYIWTSTTTLYGIYSVGRALPTGHSMDFSVGRRTPAVPESSAGQSARQMGVQSLVLWYISPF